MNWFGIAAAVVSRLPLEHWLVKPQDRSQALKELEDTLRGPQVQNKAPVSAEPTVESSVESIKPSETPTSAETARELKRRLAKELYRAELDLSAKLRIAGKPCDCLSDKHTLMLEAAAEELISNEPGNPVYSEIIAWIKQNHLKLTITAISSGEYDNEYPKMAAQFREFRKRITGTNELSAMIKPKVQVAIKPKVQVAIKPIESRPVISTIPEPHHRPRRETDLEYLADSPEFLTQTINNTGYRPKLDNAFQEAIARVKGLG